ncbi:hypothetical protein ACFVGN_28020 [Streptomyces sp. NPDC057757]|uniref:hypothetical protein n=1 Tax=Streptomyces sp. NPDC057757 TaxID=3346241 RepID=UPI0036CE7C1E
MAGHQDDDFDALLERSSLGSSPARRLRERTPLGQAHTVRRITALRQQLTQPGSAPEEAAEAARELFRLLESMGYHTDDESLDERHSTARQHVSAPSGSRTSALARRSPFTALAADWAQHPRTAVIERDHVALDEIELCGELIIAASMEPGDRLSLARIDDVLEGRN